MLYTRYFKTLYTHFVSILSRPRYLIHINYTRLPRNFVKEEVCLILLHAKTKRLNTFPTNPFLLILPWIISSKWVQTTLAARQISAYSLNNQLTHLVNISWSMLAECFFLLFLRYELKKPIFRMNRICQCSFETPFRLLPDYQVN